MKVLLFSDEEIWDVLKLLAAVLHTGNINFRATFVGKRTRKEYCCRSAFFTGFCVSTMGIVRVLDNLDATEIPDHSNVNRVAALLGVTSQQLIDALTRKTIFAQGDTVVSTLSREQSLDVRDAFVKGIYGRLFVHIVNKINTAIYKPRCTSRCSIGVLDIFGFENFCVNR